MRVRVSIDLPEDISSPTIKITSKVNQGVDDESGGVDNINFNWGKPATVPLFSSPESASTLERSGSGNFVYQAAATDRSGVIYSLEDVDPGLFSIDSETGMFSFKRLNSVRKVMTSPFVPQTFSAIFLIEVSALL